MIEWISANLIGAKGVLESLIANQSAFASIGWAATLLRETLERRVRIYSYCNWNGSKLNQYGKSRVGPITFNLWKGNH